MGKEEVVRDILSRLPDDAEVEEVLVAEALTDEAWLEVHDRLLDTWLTLYERARQTVGYPVGQDAIMPVPVVTNMTCMHSCGCENDADFMMGVSGPSEPGSRHKGMRLVATCEPCLRQTGAVPISEAEADGPRQ